MALDTTDYSSNGNDLTNNNGVAEETTDVPSGGDIGTSAKMELASSQYLSITDAAQTGLDLTSTGTIEFWFKPITIPGFYFLFAKWDSAANTGTVQGYGGTGGRLTCYVHDGSVYTGYYVASLIQTGWHHYAITTNTDNPAATTFEFFRDGVSQGNGAAEAANNGGDLPDNDDPFSIGARVGNTSYVNGYFADFRYWNDVRTDTEIADNYENHLSDPTSEANLVGYWPFEAVGGGDTAVPLRTLMGTGI